MYLEGWTIEDSGLFRLIAGMLWRPEADAAALRERRPEFGAAARLWATGRIAEIEAAESPALLEAASPFDADGNFRELSVDAQEAREDFIVRRLLESEGTAVVVLGGAHDLTSNIRTFAGQPCEYVRIRSPGYDSMCRQYRLE